MARYDPTDMLFFARAAERGSMSAAARALAVSKASVSRAVARLESALDARLLERSSRHFTVTEVGRIFLEHCRRVADEIEAAEAAVGHFQGEVRGHLRVAVPLVFGRFVLAPILPRFLQTYPDLSVELQLTNRTVDPIEEGYDLIVRAGPLADSSLLSRRIGESRYVAMAAPSYLERTGLPRHPNDLAGRPVLDLFDGARRHEWSFTRGNEAANVEVSVRLDLNDAVIRRDAAIEGLGVALLPEWICRQSAEEGKLSRVCPEWTSTRVRVLSALWPSRRNPSPRLRAFLSFLTDSLAHDAPGR